MIPFLPLRVFMLFVCIFLAATSPDSTYLRFSTMPVSHIQSQLYLDSETFVFAMFETMVYNFIPVGIQYIPILTNVFFYLDHYQLSCRQC